MDGGEEGAPGGGGAQMAKRRGGRTDIVSPGDASGKRKSREIAQKRWRFIPLLTAPRDVRGGGHWGNCGSTPWGARGRGRGRFFLDTFCNSPKMGPRRQQCGGQSRPCGLRRTWVGSPQPWPRFTGVLPRAEVVPGSNFPFSLGYCEKRQEEGGESRVGGPWWRLCVCPGLHSSGLVKSRPSGWQIFGGRKLLVSGLQKEGSLAGDGAGGLNGRRPMKNTCTSTRRAGRATSGWFLGDLRCLKARWRGSSKGLSGRMRGGMVTAGEGGGRPRGRVGARPAGSVIPVLQEVGG